MGLRLAVADDVDAAAVAAEAPVAATVAAESSEG